VTHVLTLSSITSSVLALIVCSLLAVPIAIPVFLIWALIQCIRRISGNSSNAATGANSAAPLSSTDPVSQPSPALTSATDVTLNIAS